ncbi:MAG: diguanylate cyclase [Pirellulales bacterium]
MEDPTPRTILVVDDDPACLRLFERLLSNAGYQVICANDGAEAFAQTLSCRPQIIITDWKMPRVDGIDLIRRVRDEASWYPYVLLVTHSSQQTLGLDSGADDFISKPIQAEDLLARVRAGERIVALQERLRRKNSELQIANQQLVELAITDPLTGLLNRRAFQEEAHKRWQQAEWAAGTINCLMIDIDHFKRINDTFGHAAGDAVICTVAQTLKAHLRTNDILCRFGGEEFCALLVNATPSIGRRVAERLRETIAQLTLPGLPAGLRCTISVGLASGACHATTLEAFLEWADQALLRAKRAGRNRVICYEPKGGLTRPIVPVSQESLAKADFSAEGWGEVIEAMLVILSWRNPDRAAHDRRVSRLVAEAARRLQWSDACRHLAEAAALLQDVGSLVVPATEDHGSAEAPLRHVDRRQGVALAIVQECFANRALTNTLRNLPAASEEFLADDVLDEPLAAARLVAIVNRFDNLCHGLDCLEPRETSAALETLRAEAGSRFDPQLVAAFCQFVERGQLLEATASVA